LRKLLQQIPLVDWRNALDSTMLSHIWFGNWSFLQVRSWMYHFYMYVALLALFGLVVFIVMPFFSKSGAYLFANSRKHLMFLIGLYAFFCLGLSYHVLITFVALGSSSSAGWYLYCIVIAEVVIIVAGLHSITPARIRPWILPSGILTFGLLDIYTVHFLFVPYYTGLIAHKPEGPLANFHLDRLGTIGLREIVQRLLVHKPFIGSSGMLLLWVAYLSATIVLAVIAFRMKSPRASGDPGNSIFNR
jgi:hypothetical protein